MLVYNYLVGCLMFVLGFDMIFGLICCDGVGYLNVNDFYCLCIIICELDQNFIVNYIKVCILFLYCIVVVDVVECFGFDLLFGYVLLLFWLVVGYYMFQLGCDDEFVVLL